MVNTRSQSRSSIPVFMGKANGNDRVSDSESECSIPDLLTRDQIDEHVTMVIYHHYSPLLLISISVVKLTHYA